MLKYNPKDPNLLLFLDAKMNQGNSYSQTAKTWVDKISGAVFSPDQNINEQDRNQYIWGNNYITVNPNCTLYSDSPCFKTTWYPSLGTGDFTIVMVFTGKKQGTTRGDYIFGTSGLNVTPTNRWQFLYDHDNGTGGLRIAHNVNSTWNYENPAPWYPPGDSVVAIFIRQGNTLSTYYNGVLVSTDTPSGNTYGGNQGMVLRVTYVKNHAYMIYDRALDQEEILQITSWAIDYYNLSIYPQLKSFDGLMISPQQLTYDNNSFKLKNEYWNSVAGTSGITNNSYYFSFEEIGKYFDSRGSSFTTSSGSIDNQGEKISYAGYNDWRLPTITEWSNIFGDTRVGSTINNVPNCRYTKVELSDITILGRSQMQCILVAPDNEVMTGMSTTFTWNTISSPTVVTWQQLLEYTDKGCIVFSPNGYRTTSGWDSPGTYGSFHSATEYNSMYSYRFDFGTSCSFSYGSKSNYRNVRLVRTIT